MKKIAFIGLMGAVSAVLMLMRFPIPFMPPFLSFDLSGVMEIMGGLMFGPVEALCIIVVKILLHIGSSYKNNPEHLRSGLYFCRKCLFSSGLYRRFWNSIKVTRSAALAGHGLYHR